MSDVRVKELAEFIGRHKRLEEYDGNVLIDLGGEGDYVPIKSMRLFPGEGSRTTLVLKADNGQ